MSAVLRRLRELQISPDGYRRLADATLGALVVIIASGAAVRLTGSGLGCPDWPRCNGSIVPELSTHAAIEFGNRLISAAIAVPLFALVVLAFRRVPRRPDLVRLAIVLVVLVLGQGVMGGITVLLEIRWEAVMAHYLLALALLVGTTVLAWRARQPDGAPPPHHDARLVVLARALAVYGVIVILLGTVATASGPHAGGAGTGDVVDRLDFMGAETLRRMILVHGHLANVLGWLTIALFFWARRHGASRGYVRALGATAVLIGVQGAVGLAQYHSDLPAELVWFHASAAAALLAALVWSVLEAGRRAPATAPAPAAQRSAATASSA